MITKAGVPAAKLAVGIASYGRSFGMKDPDCWGPMCKFTGSPDVSTAEPGPCTLTAGYIANAELRHIAEMADEGRPGYEVTKWHDSESASDMMVYGTHGNATTWVAYMDEGSKATRATWIWLLNMGGTTNWAVDLAKWYDGPDGSLGEDFDLSDLPDLACVSTSWPTTLEDLSNKVDSIAPACRNQVIISILIREFNDAIARYREVSEGYADKVRQRTVGDGRKLLTELGIVRRIC